jgi:hypothetical protein
MTDQNNPPGPGPGADDEDLQGENPELWKKITGETEMLRERRTPVYLKQQIMDSLDDKEANDKLWRRLTGEVEGLSDQFAEEPPRPWYEKLFRKEK